MVPHGALEMKQQRSYVAGLPSGHSKPHWVSLPIVVCLQAVHVLYREC